MSIGKTISLPLVAFIILLGNSLCADVVDKIVAIVNDQPITNAEVKATMVPISEKYKLLYEGRELTAKLNEAHQKIVQKLIHDKLILQEAKDLGIVADKQEIETYLQKVKSQFSSEEAFEAALDAQGIKIWDLQNKYKQQLTIKKAVRLLVRSRTIITPSQISEYYQKHKVEFTTPESVTAYQILLRKKETEENSKIKQEAEQILEFVRLGSNFSDLAKRYSQGPNAKRGGYMTAIEQGQMIEEIDNALFSLEPGEASGIVETDLGFHIFKVESKILERTKSLSEAKVQIEEILMEEKSEEIINEWIEELKTRAYIVIK